LPFSSLDALLGIWRVIGRLLQLLGLPQTHVGWSMHPGLKCRFSLQPQQATITDCDQTSSRCTSGISLKPPSAGLTLCAIRHFGIELHKEPNAFATVRLPSGSTPSARLEKILLDCK
jgi:hypothetical protein